MGDAGALYTGEDACHGLRSYMWNRCSGKVFQLARGMPPCQSLFSRSIFLEVTETISNERIRVMDGESRRSPVLKWVFLPLRLLYKCYFALVFFLSLVLSHPVWNLLFRPKRYQMAFRLKRTWAFFLQWVSGVPVRVERRAILPSGTVHHL